MATTPSACLGYPLNFIDSEVPGFHWQDEQFSVSAVALSHRVSCSAYVFTETSLERQLLQDKLHKDGIEPGPGWGELQKGNSVLLEDGRLLRSDDYTQIPRTAHRLIVAGDNDNPALLAEACEGAQVLIHEATYTQDVADRVGPWPQLQLPLPVGAWRRASYQSTGRRSHAALPRPAVPGSGFRYLPAGERFVA